MKNIARRVTFIRTPIGLLQYLLLRNDWSWQMLSRRDKDVVLKANLTHNLGRKGYADPENLARTFDSPGNRWADAHGMFLATYLEENRPKSVIEIGPGGGFLTRGICDFPSVRKYIGVDINPAFIDFLRPRLENYSKNNRGFSFELYSGNFQAITLPKADSVIMISSIHHIPDRFHLFKWVAEVLSANGTMFSVDPAHYLPRISLLLKKYFREYYQASYRSDPVHYSTHHFCSMGEFKRIIKKTDLEIVKCQHFRLEFPSIITKVIYKFDLFNNLKKTPEGWHIIEPGNNALRFFSNRISVVFSKVQ